MGLLTCRNDHFEMAGLAPTMIKHSVRSMSGKLRLKGKP